MLSEQEKQGISELLGMMSMEDLQALAQTVTSRLLVPKNSADAIQTIILHTDKAPDLLKRKKIKKVLLFKYLHYKSISVESISDKTVHVNRVLEVWGSNDLQNCSIVMDSDNSFEVPTHAPVPISRNTSHTSLCSLDMSREVLSSVEAPHQLDKLCPSTSIMNHDENSSNSDNVGDQSRSLHPHSDMYISPSMTLSQCQEIAIKFARWYFQLLNSSMESDMTDWSPSHFWPDSSAKVSLLSSSGESECVEVQQNAVEVSAMLVQVIRKHQLKFNPNMCEEGVRGKVSPYGLVMVLVCGTLHNQFTVCGVFEQVFGLIRDPSADNNWKIKQTEARLVGGPVSDVPSITNSRLEAVSFC